MKFQVQHNYGIAITDGSLGITLPSKPGRQHSAGSQNAGEAWNEQNHMFLYTEK